MSESIKVVCRFRGGQESENLWRFMPDGLSVKSPGNEVSANIDDRLQVKKGPAGQKDSKTFTYDKVLNSDSTQADAYIEGGRSSVQALLAGFNGTIFAYGQSGSGKTFTMLGPDSVVEAIKEGGSEGIPEDV